jgi:hypothetical protein
LIIFVIDTLCGGQKKKKPFYTFWKEKRKTKQHCCIPLLWVLKTSWAIDKQNKKVYPFQKVYEIHGQSNKIEQLKPEIHQRPVKLY